MKLRSNRDFSLLIDNLNLSSTYSVDQAPKPTMADDEDVAENIFLRPWELSDVEDFIALITNEKTLRFSGFDDIISADNGLKCLSNVIDQHPYYKAICLMNTGEAIGHISVSTSRVESSKCRANLGYIVSPKYWGKGIATKAVHMVVSTIFREWPHLKRLEAIAEVENLASNRVLEKAGFQKEGVLRQYLIAEGEPKDFVMYSLLASDVLSQSNQLGL